jgi:hypothetical protein
MLHAAIDDLRRDQSDLMFAVDALAREVHRLADESRRRAPPKPCVAGASPQMACCRAVANHLDGGVVLRTRVTFTTDLLMRGDVGGVVAGEIAGERVVVLVEASEDVDANADAMRRRLEAASQWWQWLVANDDARDAPLRAEQRAALTNAPADFWRDPPRSVVWALGGNNFEREVRLDRPWIAVRPAKKTASDGVHGGDASSADLGGDASRAALGGDASRAALGGDASRGADLGGDANGAVRNQPPDRVQTKAPNPANDPPHDH